LKIALSKRLAAIAGYVTTGEKPVDVGTDHGYIPVWLIQNGICETAIASDIREGPLTSAVQSAESAGLADKIEFRLTPGLVGYTATDADCIIIAGMGAETIIGILEEAAWTKEKKLILQPQSKHALLRNWLTYSNYGIADARLVYDTGRIYIIFLVSGAPQPDTGCIDRHLIENKDPLLAAFIEEELKRVTKKLYGLEKSKTPSGREIDEINSTIAQLKSIKKEALTWQQ